MFPIIRGEEGCLQLALSCLNKITSIWKYFPSIQGKNKTKQSKQTNKQNQKQNHRCACWNILFIYILCLRSLGSYLEFSCEITDNSSWKIYVSCFYCCCCLYCYCGFAFWMQLLPLTKKCMPTRKAADSAQILLLKDWVQLLPKGLFRCFSLN